MKDFATATVIYRDYKTPIEMLDSLQKWIPSSLSKTVYFVDNTDCLDEQIEKERAMFLSKISAYRDVVYIQAGSNLGFGKANNLALEEADSKYFAFVNPDVVFIQDAISPLISHLEHFPETGMVIPKMVDEHGGIQQVYRRELTFLDAFNRTVLKNKMRKRHLRHVMAEMDYTKPFVVPFGQGSFLFARTDLLKEIGGFDDDYFMYCEDADLCKRINSVSRLEYVPDSVVVHKWERGSSKNTSLFMKHLGSYLTYFKKWGFRFF